MAAISASHSTRTIKTNLSDSALGFRAVERRTFGEDDCIVYRLDRGDWQRRMAVRHACG
jgi:hypothetical protein